MSWKEFSYTPFIINLDKGELGHQPTLAATVLPLAGFLPFKTPMVVDSGAEDTLFDAEVGRAIGINVEAGTKRTIGGVTGVGVGYEHNVCFELPQLSSVFETQAIFVPRMGFAGILGQRDFFSKYRVKFDRSKLRFYTEKVPRLKF